MEQSIKKKHVLFTSFIYKVGSNRLHFLSEIFHFLNCCDPLMGPLTLLYSLFYRGGNWNPRAFGKCPRSHGKCWQSWDKNPMLARVAYSLVCFILMGSRLEMASPSGHFSEILRYQSLHALLSQVCKGSIFLSSSFTVLKTFLKIDYYTGNL